MPSEEVYEIRIEEVSSLSAAAIEEVRQKLLKTPKEFQYKGYAKVSYVKNSPLRVSSVDPIEGTIVTYYRDITKSLKPQSTTQEGF